VLYILFVEKIYAGDVLQLTVNVYSHRKIQRLKHTSYS